MITLKERRKTQLAAPSEEVSTSQNLDAFGDSESHVGNATTLEGRAE